MTVMKGKTIDWMFLCIILVKLVVTIGVTVLFMISNGAITLAIVPNLILSELLLVIPALIFVAATRTRLRDVVSFRKIQFKTILMIIVLVYLSMPLITVINAISMMFTENVVATISTDILKMPFLTMLFLMGIYGPVCEELVFRGLMYTGYKKSASILQAMLLSALLFGLMHMNLNQALYAFVIGCILVLLKEATDSIWAPIIFHVVFNSHTVILLYVTERWMPNLPSEAVQEAMTGKMMLITISVYMVIAMITTALGWCVLVWIAEHEHRTRDFGEIQNGFTVGKRKTLTAPLLMSIILCVAYIGFDFLLSHL
ncbi:MAG: type II CAAX endopeptidase family protein [Lachnospiraceae bacterium]